MGKSVAATKAVLLDGASWAHDLPKIAETSFSDLRSREQRLHVSISQHIEERWRERRLFFTFNHPSQYLLKETASALLKRVGLAPDGGAGEDGREPLDRIIPALLPPVVEALHLSLPVNLSTKGCRVTEGSVIRTTNEVVHYSLDTLIEQSFRCLSDQCSPDDNLRIT
jgi:hypothetical protein